MTTRAFDTPTGILRDQHQKILKVADILEQVPDAGPQSPPADMDALSDCVTFIRLFADALHHGKEEDLLFPALVAHGMPQEDGPIAVMLHEHALGRGFARAMADELPAARGGDAAAGWARASPGLCCAKAGRLTKCQLLMIVQKTTPIAWTSHSSHKRPSGGFGAS